MVNERETKPQGTVETPSQNAVEAPSQIAVEAPLSYGAELLFNQPKDSYSPNGLPPIDASLHTQDVIAELQKRAMQID
jgi:hypothetical protein